MRIECKNCRATYSVPQEKIPPKGKKVKCTNCQNVWLFLPSEGKEIGPSTPKPRRSKKRSFSFRDASLVALMIPLLFFFSSTFQKKVPYEVRKLYRVMEIYDTSHINLAESNIKIIGTGENEMLVKVSWVVENGAKEERFVPGVNFIFYDGEGRRVFSKRLEVDKYGLIPPGARTNFEKTIAAVPCNVETVRVKVGNIFEVLL